LTISEFFADQETEAPEASIFCDQKGSQKEDLMAVMVEEAAT
jgi:hypothetical protein